MEEQLAMEGVRREGILTPRNTPNRRGSTGMSPATKRMKDIPAIPVLSDEVLVPDIEAGSDFTKCLPIDLLITILFCFHTPDYVRKFSTLSKSHLQICISVMREMCRRRWMAKANFEARWASANLKSIDHPKADIGGINADGGQFWYRQYFHEESIVGIPREELTRLVFSCEIRSHLQSSRPKMISHSIKFNNTTAKYVQDNPTRTEKDEGRVEVNGEMVGHPTHCSNKSKSGTNSQCPSIDWFLYQGGSVIKLGLPLLKPHPGRPRWNNSLIFYVERDDSWRWTLMSSDEIMRSID